MVIILSHKDYDDVAMRAKVDALIQQEMKEMEAKDYLSGISTLMSDEELDAIMHRVENV